MEATFGGRCSPTPLPRQGYPERVAQELVQVGFERLQRLRLHDLLGHPVPVLCHPQCKESLPHAEVEFLVF